jgi:hypothetical protein
MNPTEQHEVVFITSSEITAKRTRRPLALWDSTTACRMIEAIAVLDGARPFAFYFTSWLVEPDRVNALGVVVKGTRKLIRTSSLFFVGATEAQTKDWRRQAWDAHLSPDGRLLEICE